MNITEDNQSLWTIFAMGGILKKRKKFDMEVVHIISVIIESILGYSGNVNPFGKLITPFMDVFQG